MEKTKKQTKTRTKANFNSDQKNALNDDVTFFILLNFRIYF